MGSEFCWSEVRLFSTGISNFSVWEHKHADVDFMIHKKAFMRRYMDRILGTDRHVPKNYKKTSHRQSDQK